MREKMRQRGGGFTLAEVLLASAILAVMVTAVTSAIVAGQAQSYDALHEERAMALGEALLEEVLSRPYHDPGGENTFGPDGGEDAADRSTFDAVDDFHGYAEAAGGVNDPAGVMYPDLYQRFGRSVQVAADTVSVPAFGTTQNVLAVTVTVAEPGGRAWTLTRLVPEALE